MIRKMMDQKIPPTKELLLLCARSRLNSDAGARIRAIAQEDLDWAELIAVAADQGVAPLVCDRLEVWAGDVLPPLWRDQFREEFERIARRNLFLSAELCRVLRALGAAGVCATPYKGPVLAVQAYGDIALRQFGDLDIIVPQTQIPVAHRVLVQLGFQSTERAAPDVSRRIPGQYAYWSETPARNIELHTEATLRYFPRRLDLVPMLARREIVSLAGSDVRTFSPEDTLLLLAVHGSKHFWDRLGWIADIAAFAGGAGRLDWELALDRARRVGAERMVLLAVSLACALLDAPLPESVTALVKRNAAARQLSSNVRTRFLAPRPIGLGIFSRFAFRARMCGTTKNGFLYAFRLAVMPTEADRRENPIANHFEPLHGLLRPLRLARLYGWRTQASQLSPVTRQDIPCELAGKLLAFAKVCSNDFVLDSLTGSGQLALLAAKMCGTGGIGIVSDSRMVAQAKIAARAQGTSARVRFFEQTSDAELDDVDFQLPTVLFVNFKALSSKKVRSRVGAAISSGVRVVSIGGDIAGLPPSRAARVDLDGGEFAALKMWEASLGESSRTGAKVGDCKL